MIFLNMVKVHIHLSMALNSNFSYLIVHLVILVIMKTGGLNHDDKS